MMNKQNILASHDAKSAYETYMYMIWVAITQVSKYLYMYKAKQKNMCVYCYMLKKIRFDRSKIIFCFSFIFYNSTNVEWHLECISTLQEWHLSHF